MQIALAFLAVFGVLALIAWGLCVAANNHLYDEDDDYE
jgi:hypothetical protein